MKKNKFGLSRYIPSNIRLEIRKRSKFGCVICRCGFYQYEHIDPTFENAKEHNPDNICCLCGTCHDLVTRGAISKQAIIKAYESISNTPSVKVVPPEGPLDFHEGRVELIIGGLFYSPAVNTLLRYHGINIIQLFPSKTQDEPGKISAIFTDDDGNGVLWLEENAWIGSLESWDIEVRGNRLTVRKNQARIVLQLRLDPPGRIVIERLDMRIFDGHILATEKTYAVGRYLSNGNLHWTHADIKIRKSSHIGAAIEFTIPELLEKRDKLLKNTGADLSTDGRVIVINANAGILVKPLGIAIASLCGSFDLAQIACGIQSLAEMRRVIISHPTDVCSFISTGELGNM